MGIKDLKKFLRENYGDVLKSVPLSNFKGKKIAIDVMAIFYPHWCVVQSHNVKKMGKDLITEEFNLDNIREGWMDLVWKSLKRILMEGLIPVMVFDGKADDAKSDTKDNRKKISDTAKESIEKLKKELREVPAELYTSTMLEPLKKKYSSWKSIREEDVLALMKFFEGLGLPVIVATREAEELCSFLCINKIVSAVYSTDTDNLAHRCPVWIHDIESKDGVNYAEVIYYQDVIDSLGFTPIEFLDFCILCGCDYNKPIYKLGPITSYNLIKKYGKIESLQGIRTAEEIGQLNHIKCRELFSNKDDLKVPTLGLDIDKSCIQTYSTSYLTPYKMEYILPEIDQIYKTVNYEEVKISINLSGLKI